MQCQTSSLSSKKRKGCLFRCDIGAECFKKTTDWAQGLDKVQIERKMGNKLGRFGSSKEDTQNCIDVTGFEVDDEELLSDRRRHRKTEVDWEDEKSVCHRSAMNCLHNYALGKMCEDRLMESKDAVYCDRRMFRRTDSGKSLTFADNLEETFVFINSETCSHARVDAHSEDATSSDSSNDGC